MELDSLFTWLEETNAAQFIQVSDWAFPSIESVHVIAITFVVGMIAVVDLRLIGIASKRLAAIEMLKDNLIFVWIAFAVALLSGSLLFVSAARSYAHNGPFQAKMVLMLLAGVNMLIFELFIARSAATWSVERLPLAARISGALSLMFWIAIVAFGRWIGFTKMG